MPRLDVFFNPTALPPATVPNTQMEPSTSANKEYDKQLSLASIGKIAVGSIAVKQVATTLFGSVGDLTGNRQLQRNLNEATQILGYGVQIAIAGPLVGGSAVVAQVVSQEISERIIIRNQNINANYKSNLRRDMIRGNR